MSFDGTLTEASGEPDFLIALKNTMFHLGLSKALLSALLTF
jgi:hypothetical protein